MEKGGEGNGEAENVGRGGERNVPENLTCWTSCRACCSEVRPLPSTLELRKRTLVISMGLSRWRKDLLDAVGVEEGRREGDSREDAARSAPTFSGRMSVMSSIEPANVQLQIVNSRALFLCYISTAAQRSVRRAHRMPSIQSRHRG